MSGTTRSKDGTVIAFDRQGDGPPLVLVHPATSHRAFNPQMAELAGLLASDFTVFNYDRRGRGESGDTPTYAVERELEDLDAIIARAGGSAFVYGMSSGAALVLEAANRGLGIRRQVLYEAPFIVDGSRPPVPPEYLAHLTELVAAGRRGDAVEYFMTVGAGAPAEVVAGMRATPGWPMFEAVAPTLVYDATLLEGAMNGRPLPPERTAWVTAPSLVIAGRGAPPSFHATAAALTEALPHSRLITLDGEFHALPAATLAPAIRDFLSE